MRLRIEASQDEIVEKSEVLIKALADSLAPVAPDIAERLEKAIPKDIPKLRQPALREIHERTRKLYEARLKWMLKDIGEVLDRSLKKAEETEPGEEPEKLEPGDIDPETGEEVPEEEEEIEPEEPEEETE